MATTTTNSSSDPQVVAAENAYQANEANIRQYSTDLVNIRTAYDAAVAKWRKLSSDVAGTIFLPMATLSEARKAKTDADRLQGNINSKTAQLNSALDQRAVLARAVQDAQANAIQNTLASAQADPEIVKARTELEALLSSSRTKRIIFIVIGLVIIASAGGYFYLKYKNKI